MSACTHKLFSAISLRLGYSEKRKTNSSVMTFLIPHYAHKLYRTRCVKLSQNVVDISARAPREQGSHAICVCDSVRVLIIVSTNVGFRVGTVMRTARAVKSTARAVLMACYRSVHAPFGGLHSISGASRAAAKYRNQEQLTEHCRNRSRMSRASYRVVD
jgi:hypothetical protein